MTADEHKNLNKKGNIQSNGSSDRKRIKNITKEVHPEYVDPGERSKRRKENSRQLSSEEQKQRLADARRRQQRIERRKKIRQRQKRQRALRRLAACLVLAALVMTVLIVKNYNSGSRHDNKGITAYENGNFDLAVQEFKEALSYDGQNADYYIHLGMTYIETKAFDQALGYFNQADSCVENDEQRVLLNRGRGIACLYQGNYSDAVSWFKNALESLGQNKDLRADILYYKAEAEEKSGDYAAAVQSYGQIIDLADDAGARMLRGMAYMTLSDYAAAETDLYAAIAQSRKSYSIYRALYSALEAQGKTEEANQVLNDALKLSGSSGEDYFNRGMIYMDLQDDVHASEMLNQSYEKGYTAALLGLGEIAVHQKDYETARGYYETFFSEADGKKTDTSMMAKGYNQYAICLMAMGDYESAAAACESGLKYNDRNVDQTLSFNLIAAYEQLARWEEAYNASRDYISKYPDDEAGMKEYHFLESRITH